MPVGGNKQHAKEAIIELSGQALIKQRNLKKNRACAMAKESRQVDVPPQPVHCFGRKLVDVPVPAGLSVSLSAESAGGDSTGV
jgi:hypothetical protein